jgi:tRNA-dihydrouridine synthase
MQHGFAIGDVRIGSRVLMAPMTGVSDLPFRLTASRQGAAYVATEMVACETFAKGRPDVVRRAAVGEGLPLTVIQLVGREAKWLARGAEMAEAAGADIVDINMGCPAKEVTGGLSGSALMRDLDLAEALDRSRGERDLAPVTLKDAARLGRCQPQCASACRTRRKDRCCGHHRARPHPAAILQGQGGLARGCAGEAGGSRYPSSSTATSSTVASARAALTLSGADAVMIGRGGYGRPWIAREIDRALRDGGDVGEPSLAERLVIALEHLRCSLRFHGDVHGVKIFRKHLGWYIENAALARFTRRAPCREVGNFAASPTHAKSRTA